MGTDTVAPARRVRCDSFGRYLVATGVLRFGIEFLESMSGWPLASVSRTSSRSPRLLSASSCSSGHSSDTSNCPVRLTAFLMRRFYLITRDLHLYVGLFVSPFVLVFSVSVFYLVHGLAQRPSPDQSASSRTVNNLVVPPGLAGMQGRARVDALRPVLDQAGVSGEVDFVRHLPGEHRLIVPVRLPNRDTVVSLDYEQRTATITSREHSIGDALVYLHKMPGPHNVDVRGNSPLMRWWRVLADATAYLTLFISVSGIYLWVALKAERRMGLVLVLAGAITFWGLVYAIAA